MPINWITLLSMDLKSTMESSLMKGFSQFGDITCSSFQYFRSFRITQWNVQQIPRFFTFSNAKWFSFFLSSLKLIMHCRTVCTKAAYGKEWERVAPKWIPAFLEHSNSISIEDCSILIWYIYIKLNFDS